jgi:transposase
MRGNETPSGSLFSYVSLESRIPQSHPLRPIKVMVDAALKALDKDFDGMYANEGRPSIPPEQLLRALLIQLLYSIRSERQLVEQLDYNLLFRWFVGLGVDDKVWDASSFTTNRERMQRGEIAGKFFEQILNQARQAGLISKEHFSVDGTFIEAWASQKSFRRKDDDGPPPGPGRNAEADFHGEKRTNKTHESTSDPDSRLMRKGGGAAKLVHHGHILTENRNGLVVATEVTVATGKSEVEAAGRLLEQRGAACEGTVGADKGYDCLKFVETARGLGVTPHVAQNITPQRDSMIDKRTTRHEGYEISMAKRKRIEEPFGWLKTVGNLRKTRHRGTTLVGWIFRFAMAAYNLVRMRSLMQQG